MPEAFKLSQEQNAAVKHFGADLGVSAGAGSGKTTVLVERYLEAVVSKAAWPEEILAVTFTDKAANVLKERLRSLCAQRGLDELRRRLDGAWIGTIHSFCARFLKENPLECGVDPLFTVMGKGEQEMLMEKAMDVLFEENASSAVFVRLLADASEENIRKNLKHFYDKLRAYAGDKDLLSSVPPEKERMVAENALRAALERESDAQGNLQEEKLASASKATLEALSSQPGWPRRSHVLAAVYELDLRSKKTKDRVAQLWRVAEAWSALEVQVLALPFKNEWKRLLARFTELYEREKRRLGAHDYDDLLVLTHRTLSGTSAAQKALCARTQRHFRFIFVDEYQDTSILQARIFELIKQKGNLFVVGDVRQSIYRFRHAHPEIFIEALQKSKALALAENYRSRPEILSFANGLFGSLFGQGYEPLVSRRAFKLKKEHSLELIAVGRTDDRQLDAFRVIEARTIASRIRQMVESGFKVEEGGKPRAAAWKDFAVLLRRTTASRLYEKELEAAGIPYYANKGRGFYDKIEVSDLVNLLRVLESPSEDIAMASVLRSPFAQVSDDALFWLSRKRLQTRPEISLFEACLRHAEVTELSTADRTKLTELMPLLQELSSQKDRMRISELLHAAVLETAYEAKVLAGPDGRQAGANIWKLIEMASDVEDKSARGISDFILYLQSVSESSEAEAEARIVGEEEDVVRILTVHAAKGLEFPVTVLADMGGEDGRTAKPIFTCSVPEGLGVRLRDPEGMDFCEDAAYSAIEGDEKKKEEEEFDRLLYVAMTRAKEHLIFSGVLAPRMRQIEEALEKSKQPYYRVPVVTARPAPRLAPEPLIRRLDESVDIDAARKMDERLEPVVKPYEAWEDLTVSRLMAATATSPHGTTFGGDMFDGDGLEEEEDATPRNEFGTLFHFLMESSARQAPRGRLADERLEELTKCLTPSEKKEILRGFERFWKSALGASVQKSSKCYPELPFLYKTRHGLLKGQIDLVFREQKGWTLVDYKTNRLADASEMSRAVEAYRPQLGLYALAFWKLYGEIPQKTVLYFTALDQAVELAWTGPELEKLNSHLDEWYRKALDF